MIGTMCRVSAGLAVLADVIFLANSVGACPKGTVFSAYGENCVIKGAGSKEAVKCQRAKGACPSGFKRHESNKDPGVFFCCPSSSDRIVYPFGMGPEFDHLTCRWDGTAPICKGHCKEGEIAKTASPNGKNLGKFSVSFGSACASGLKHLCCRQK